MPYITYYVCFIQTLIILCTVYEIMLNMLNVLWPLLDFQRSSKVKCLNVNWTIIHVYDFVCVFHRNIGHSTHRFWDISPNISQLDLSDLENDLYNNSIKSILWQLINIIPKQLYAENKEKLSDRFLATQPFFGHFGPWKIAFIKQFLRKLPPSEKWARFDLSDL